MFSFCRLSRCTGNICLVALFRFLDLDGKGNIRQLLFWGRSSFLIRISWRIGSFFGWKKWVRHLLLRFSLSFWTKNVRFICPWLWGEEKGNGENFTELFMSYFLLFTDDRFDVKSCGDWSSSYVYSCSFDSVHFVIFSQENFENIHEYFLWLCSIESRVWPKFAYFRMWHHGYDSILLSEILFKFSTDENIFKNEYPQKGTKSYLRILYLFFELFWKNVISHCIDWSVEDWWIDCEVVLKGYLENWCLGRSRGYSFEKENDVIFILLPYILNIVDY